MRPSFVAATALVLACSSSAANTPSAVSATSAAEVDTDDAHFHVAIFTAPEATLSRGVNTLRLVVTNKQDSSIATSVTSVHVVPWMPAMGHGASVKPHVQSDVSPGVFLATDVNAFMPGLWEIRLTIDDGHAHQATARFDVR